MQSPLITYVQHVSVPEVVFGVFPPHMQSDVLRRKALQQLQDLCYHLIHLCSIACMLVLMLTPVAVALTMKQGRTTSRGYEQQCLFLLPTSA